MSEYYKIRYTVAQDAKNVRSIIMSSIDEDAAKSNFKLAFIGVPTFIVSIGRAPRLGSLGVSALAPLERLQHREYEPPLGGFGIWTQFGGFQLSAD